MGTIFGPNGTAGQNAQMPEVRDAREQLPLLVDRVTIAVESLRTQWRTVSELGTHERMAVAQLRVYGSMPMSELASRISLSRAAVTSLVDRLEATGWVRRQPDEHDRRRTVLRLMPRAADRYEEVSERYWHELVDWARTLPEAEWDAFRTGLELMGQVAERQAEKLRTTAPERSLD
ncbi:MAG: MarR family transcriptional regulator [Thermoleophilia bacterium]|nr:MarR family transcriptional regulator [Thermoleophilia bacterium]